MLVSGSGPAYAPIAEMEFDQARAVLDEHLLGSLRIARECAARVRAGGSLTFITGTHALALHLMTNTALTGATYDVDGGQQLVP